MNISDDTQLQQLLPLTSPVYLQPGSEYCLVFLTNSLEYRMWISQLGELDVGAGNRLVSRQPSLGVCLNHKTIEHGTQFQFKI